MNNYFKKYLKYKKKYLNLLNGGATTSEMCSIPHSYFNKDGSCWLFTVATSFAFSDKYRKFFLSKFFEFNESNNTLEIMDSLQLENFNLNTILFIELIRSLIQLSIEVNERLITINEFTNNINEIINEYDDHFNDLANFQGINIGQSNRAVGGYTLELIKHFLETYEPIKMGSNSEQIIGLDFSRDNFEDLINEINRKSYDFVIVKVMKHVCSIIRCNSKLLFYNVNLKEFINITNHHDKLKSIEEWMGTYGARQKLIEFIGVKFNLIGYDEIDTSDFTRGILLLPGIKLSIKDYFDNLDCTLDAKAEIIKTILYLKGNSKLNTILPTMFGSISISYLENLCPDKLHSYSDIKRLKSLIDDSSSFTLPKLRDEINDINLRISDKIPNVKFLDEFINLIVDGNYFLNMDNSFKTLEYLDSLTLTDLFEITEDKLFKYGNNLQVLINFPFRTYSSKIVIKILNILQRKEYSSLSPRIKSKVINLLDRCNYSQIICSNTEFYTNLSDYFKFNIFGTYLTSSNQPIDDILKKIYDKLPSSIQKNDFINCLRIIERAYNSSNSGYTLTSAINTTTGGRRFRSTPGASTPTPGASTPTPGASTPTPGASTPTPGVSTPTPSASTPTPSASTPTPSASTPPVSAGFTYGVGGRTLRQGYRLISRSSWFIPPDLSSLRDRIVRNPRGETRVLRDRYVYSLGNYYLYDSLNNAISDGRNFYANRIVRWDSDDQRIIEREGTLVPPVSEAEATMSPIEAGLVGPEEALES